MLVGVWVAVLLFLGFSPEWHKILAVATGLYLIILAYSLKSDAPQTTDLRVPFVEHKATEVEAVPEVDGATITTTGASPETSTANNTDSSIPSSSNLSKTNQL